MAEFKKYLDTTALGALVDQIKAEDAKALAAAKKYTDDSVKGCDVAGAASTAEANAKAYTDQLANGAVKTNTEAIAKLNGSATTEGSVAKAIADAMALIGEDVDAVEAKADKNAEDIAAINHADTGILAQAKKYTDDEVAGVQGEVDALEGYVGTFTHETAKTVVEYVDAKTSGIASSDNLNALGERVTAVEGDVATIKGDYLKASDKTELEGKITNVQTAVDTEKQRAEGVEGGFETRIKAIEDDYLKAADKTELQGNIDAVSGAVERLTNGVSTEEIDGVNDLIQYVKDHGTEVTGMQEDIADNAEAISGVAGRMDTAEGKITTLEGAVATKAEKEYVDEQVEALQGVDTGLANRITAIEGKFGDGEGSVEDMIADAKQEAIDTAAGDATTKAGQALTDAKAYTDTEVGKDRARLDALEAIEHHTHTNKAVLDGITEAKVTAWDNASAKSHEHTNKTVLDGITAENVTTWNTVTSKAAQTALDAAVERIAANEGAIGTLQTTVADKAEQDDLDAAVERIGKNETDIATLTSTVNSFTPITAEEVAALFA